VKSNTVGGYSDDVVVKCQTKLGSSTAQSDAFKFTQKHKCLGAFVFDGATEVTKDYDQTKGTTEVSVASPV